MTSSPSLFMRFFSCAGQHLQLTCAVWEVLGDANSCISMASAQACPERLRQQCVQLPGAVQAAVSPCSTLQLADSWYQGADNLLLGASKVHEHLLEREALGWQLGALIQGHKSRGRHHQLPVGHKPGVHPLLRLDS